MIEYIFLFIIGLCIGSFLNVCICRLPKELSIIKPGSFCPRCKTPIKWFDNIPLFSYFVLRAKCRSCQGKISFRYPLIELITACLFVFLYYKFSLSLDFLKFAIFFSLLIVVSFIDIDYHAIPVYLCFLGIIAGLLFSIYDTVLALRSGDVNNLAIVTAFKNLIFGFGFAYLFKFLGDILLTIYLSLRKKESIEGEKESLGLGDVDFIGMVSLFLGAHLAVITFFIAPFIAVVYSVFALMFKKSHLIPYLPYLSAAALASFLWGGDILTFLGFI